jgi:hypothetical protein
MFLAMKNEHILDAGDQAIFSECAGKTKPGHLHGGRGDRNKGCFTIVQRLLHHWTRAVIGRCSLHGAHDGGHELAAATEWGAGGSKT